MRTGVRGVPQGCPQPWPPTDCRRYETQRRRKYVVGMSSGAAADKLISENTTRHVQRAADHMILSEHTASSGPKSVGRGTRPSNVFLYWVCSETPPREEPCIRCLDTGLIFCSTYCVFERAPRPRRTFYGTLDKIQNSRSASEFLRSTNTTS